MKLFVTGIGTDVGKTIASAILTEALQADYWKPIQAGELENSDSHKVKRYITNTSTHIYPNSYKLQTPASPHHAAALEDVEIDIKQIKEPAAKNNLVIEGAGGLFVPLNSKHTIADIIKPDYKVIVVSRHYLGSINHTLLTIETLKQLSLNIGGIIFSGDENKATEDIILSKTGISMIGRIENEPFFDKTVIRQYADDFLENIEKLY